MKQHLILPARRAFLRAGAATAALALAPGIARAAGYPPTPRQTEGPFYPDRMPLDTDNDLVRISGGNGHAKGTVTHVFGRVTDMAGRPVRGALVEIWQCDSRGRYIHTGDTRRDPRDPHFQGYGRTVTDAQGRYRFRTIRPVPYSSRAPHIHFAVKPPDGGRLVTQMYIAGAPENDDDGPLNRIRDPAAKRSLIVTLGNADHLQIGALYGEFDIVLGRG